MKVKELMIGDIIAYKDNICFVGSIENLGGLVGIENDTICELVADTELSPVPLTKDILMKNGFITVNNHTLSEIYRKSCGKYDEYEVVVGLLNGWMSVESFDEKRIEILKVNFRLRYVHELQHALRLCGLNELADNFKTK